MNKNRRKTIDNIRAEIETMSQRLSELQTDVELVQGEEEEYHENMPEAIQYGDKGATAQEAIDALGSAYDELDTAVSALDEVVGYLETAVA